MQTNYRKAFVTGYLGSHPRATLAEADARYDEEVKSAELDALERDLESAGYYSQSDRYWREGRLGYDIFVQDNDEGTRFVTGRVDVFDLLRNVVDGRGRRIFYRG